MTPKGVDDRRFAGGSVVDIAFTDTGNPNDGVGGPIDLTGAELNIPTTDTIAHVDADAADASGAGSFDTHLTGLDTSTFDPSTIGPDGTDAMGFTATEFVVAGADLQVSFDSNQQLDASDNLDTDFQLDAPDQALDTGMDDGNEIGDEGSGPLPFP